MDEQGKKQQSEALQRAKQPGRPSGLSDHSERLKPGETLADDAGFERPERAEHTSEKEHPPGKE